MNLIRGTSYDTRPARWPGFDWGFYADSRERARCASTRTAIAKLGQRYTLSGIKPIPFASPVLINNEAAARLQHFCHTYHRLISTIVSRYQTDRRLQETITLPPAIAEDARRDQSKVKNTVSICRVDFYMHESGDFSVLETNANCPGSLLYSGIGAAFWRRQMPDVTPAPLPSEDLNWYGDWYMRTAQALTGTRPRSIAMLRQDRGYRYEFDEITAAFQALGATTTELDPRHLSQANMPPHAYLKLSIPEFAQMRGQLDTFVEAVLAGDLYIQNGLLGRWIGDNKLCLAVLSDPAFADLFDPADLSAVSPHIPWSRNIAQCGPAEISDILKKPSNYVLKRPLDTRGRGVVIGREIESPCDWSRSVACAIHEGWLVMEHIEPTRINPQPDCSELFRHDLALGLINGEIGSALVRSSKDSRVNVALSGRVHPVFLDR